MTSEKETPKDSWQFATDRSYTTKISKPQMNRVKIWLEFAGGIQRDILPGPRYARLGELTEIYDLKEEPVFLHTRPDRENPGKFIYRIDVSTTLAEALMKDKIIKNDRPKKKKA